MVKSKDIVSDYSKELFKSINCLKRRLYEANHSSSRRKAYKRADLYGWLD